MSVMHKPPVWEARERSNIRWARFNVNIFISYPGIGCSDDKEAEEKAGDVSHESGEL